MYSKYSDGCPPPKYSITINIVAKKLKLVNNQYKMFWMSKFVKHCMLVKRIKGEKQMEFGGRLDQMYSIYMSMEEYETQYEGNCKRPILKQPTGNMGRDGNWRSRRRIQRMR